MKKVLLLITTMLICSCSAKNDRNDTTVFKYGEGSQAIHICSADDFLKIDRQNELDTEEIIAFLDSLIPDNFDLLSEICHSEENSNSSDNLKKVCSIYKIYLLLCKKDVASAKAQIEKVLSDGVANYQLDKFTGFYYWCVGKYESANWYAGFYLFRRNKEKRRVIRRSTSRIKFEIRFRHDPAFKYLKNNVYAH